MADSTRPGEPDKVEAQKARHRERERIRYKKNRESIRSKQQAYREKNRDSDLHRQRKRSHDKTYRDRHRHRLLAYHREYYVEHQDVARARNAKRYLQNKTSIIARHVRNQARRRLEDECFALAGRVRARVREALSRSGVPRKQNTLTLVGCTAAELKSHIESLFSPGMSWGNRHLWHVDHIIPLSKFDLRDQTQQAAAFHYTNLQPLWAKDNLKKSDKVPGQSLFGFAYAARIVDASVVSPKRRRRNGDKGGHH